MHSKKNEFFNYVCDSVAVKILTGKSYPSLTQEGIYVTPITRYNQSEKTPYPSSAISYRDPMSYSHFKNVMGERDLNIGDFIYTEIDRKKKYIWFVAANHYNYLYSLERLEDCIQNISVNRAHDEGILFIPLLGRYREDNINPKEFVSMVIEYLSDGRFDVILVEDY